MHVSGFAKQVQALVIVDRRDIVHVLAFHFFALKARAFAAGSGADRYGNRKHSSSAVHHPVQLRYRGQRVYLIERAAHVDQPRNRDQRSSN
jgi:hypothetical protein